MWRKWRNSNAGPRKSNEFARAASRGIQRRQPAMDTQELLGDRLGGRGLLLHALWIRAVLGRCMDLYQSSVNAHKTMNSRTPFPKALRFLAPSLSVAICCTSFGAPDSTDATPYVAATTFLTP